MKLIRADECRQTTNSAIDNSLEDTYFKLSLASKEGLSSIEVYNLSDIQYDRLVEIGFHCSYDEHIEITIIRW